MTEQWKGYETDAFRFANRDLPKVPVVVIDHRPEVYEHIHSDGKTFVVGGIYHQGKEFVVDEIDLDADHDTEYTNNMICPYCGYEDIDSWEFDYDVGECDCPRCGKTFEYTRQVEVTYCTEKVGGEG